MQRLAGVSAVVALTAIYLICIETVMVQRDFEKLTVVSDNLT